jgi:RHS repeat-associated protein
LTGLTHQLTIGSIQRTLGYDASRLPMNSIQAKIGSSYIQNLSLSYGTAGYNNGNIASITNRIDPTRDQSYYYDNMNRVTQGGDSTTWGEQYGYDNWGNLLSKTPLAGSSPGFTVTANANNQLSTLTYDAAGNVTADLVGNTYTYDEESRIVATAGGVYTYDGDGNRIVKNSFTAGTTLYWPDSVTGIIDESDSTGTNFGKQVFVAGLKVWSEDISGNGRYLFQDQINSTRITTDASGNVLDDIDYRSFGDIAANHGASPSGTKYVFTGYEDDTADSSTDYAVFRNLSSTTGRFISPDPYMGSYDFTNPQSFNRYAYVLNTPLVFVDPLGLDHWEGNCYVTVSGDYSGPILVVSASAQCFDGPGGGPSGSTSSGQQGVTGGGSPSSPEKKKKDCGKILSGAALTVALDAAGTFAGAIPGAGAALVGTQVAIGFAGAVNSSYHGDVGGTMAAAGGSQLSAAAAGFEIFGFTAAKTFGGAVARSLPGIGSAVSAYYFYKDATEALDKYQACKAGIGG